jgi:amidase
MRRPQVLVSRATLGVILAGAVTGCGGPASNGSTVEVVDATIDQLQTWMESGELTSRELVQLYLERIYSNDRGGPRINSLVELNPDALAIADSLDQERRQQGPRGPLHGIPVILKDAISTADRMRTTNGSYLFMDAVVVQDATVASRLREAGAVLLAKSTMDEMACCNGVVSARGGGVRNPYDLDRSASGSSGGSAAAVAANFGVVSLGGDTRSSIRFPASVTSVVGLKPTMGLISRAGVIPGDVHLDVVGPLARTVTDVAITTGILAGPDPRDPYTRRAPAGLPSDYRPFLREGALQGARLGIARKGFFGINSAIDTVMEGALASLERAGAVLVDSVVIEAIPYGGDREEDVALLEVSALRAFDDYMRGLGEGSPARSLDQFTAQIWLSHYPTALQRGHSGWVSWFSPDTLRPADYPITHPDVVAAFERFIEEQRNIVLSEMEEHDLDAIIFPTTSTLPELFVETMDVAATTSRGQPEIANYGGLPEITVPAGYTGAGFPVGLSLLGRPFSEGELFGLAFAFETATHHRKSPDLAKRPTPVSPDLDPLPANDNFADRTSLVGAEGTVRGSNLRAGVEVSEPRFNQEGIDRTVWYSYRARETGELVLDVGGSSPNRQDLAVFVGARYGDLELLGAGTVDADRPFDSELKAPRLSIRVVGGTTYQIVVGTSYDGVRNGRFQLNWRLIPDR